MDQTFQNPQHSATTSPNVAQNSKQLSKQLELRYGGCSLQGLRDENQDALIVKHPSTLSERELKGSIACIADGVSCSDHGQQASHTSVIQFVTDYYATPNSWTVKHSGQKVLTALNSWLFNSSEKQNLAHNGLVTTFSTVIFKSNTAHIFHVGDSRIYLFRNGKLRLLTRDHQRNSFGNNHFLTRALGMDNKLDIDYQTLTIEQGDVFLLTTDGVHEYLPSQELVTELENSAPNLEHQAQSICHKALSQSSKDNITSLIVEVTQLPAPSAIEFQHKLQSRAIPPALTLGNRIDNFEVTKVIHAGARSHVYEVRQIETHQRFVLKTPSLHYSDDRQTLVSFCNEQWAGSQLDNPRIMKVYPSPLDSKFLYQLCEPIQGITLRQWMYDNPEPEVDTVRNIIKGVISAVRVLQRAEMVHRDLKPENIMILPSGDIKLIDLGAVLVKGLEEIQQDDSPLPPLGAANYIAPEYLNGSSASTQSDLFSVAVICYEMLTGHLPYKEVDTQSLSQARHQSWQYRSMLHDRSHLPNWLDLTIKKACHPNPKCRYQVLGEFVTDLTRPNQQLEKEFKQQPVLQRNPVFFWKCLAVMFATVAIAEFLILI
ncbi:bifunctional protein-serine/threonine kinase/phosphatase [Vibrio sp. T187]|uniref:bifunctional protein-serine/threonine kinase/phosphatase n=1 Tax=Vibrio TaxID=662 RepID=UPI0010C9CAFD|nr:MULTISPECIES: bifunctional protein-serine/threonine kinase/phosphatase [Vibrio]MBW3696147.1 bifunctional protein-serine/threonine kinase/phosphatase [Vibrio sp. T187]